MALTRNSGASSDGQIPFFDVSSFPSTKVGGFSTKMGPQYSNATYHKTAQSFYGKVSSGSAAIDMQRIIARYAALVNMMRDMTPAVMFQAMIPIYAKSQMYVPKKSGALASTGRLTVENQGGDPKVSITYGNDKVPYAAVVHEFVWINHNPPTRAKFLQAAMEEEYNQLRTNLVRAYQAAMV